MENNDDVSMKHGTYSLLKKREKEVRRAGLENKRNEKQKEYFIIRSDEERLKYANKNAESFETGNEPSTGTSAESIKPENKSFREHECEKVEEVKTLKVLGSRGNDQDKHDEKKDHTDTSSCVYSSKRPTASSENNHLFEKNNAGKQNDEKAGNHGIAKTAKDESENTVYKNHVEKFDSGDGRKNNNNYIQEAEKTDKKVIAHEASEKKPVVMGPTEVESNQDKDSAVERTPELNKVPMEKDQDPLDQNIENAIREQKEEEQEEQQVSKNNEEPRKTDNEKIIIKERPHWLKWIVLLLLIMILALCLKVCHSKKDVGKLDKKSAEERITESYEVATGKGTGDDGVADVSEQPSINPEKSVSAVATSNSEKTLEQQNNGSVETENKKPADSKSEAKVISADTTKTEKEDEKTERHDGSDVLAPSVDAEYLDVFGYKIYTVYSGRKIIFTLPEGVVSKDDISSFFEYEAEKYPELDRAVYFISGNKVTVTAPEDIVSGLRPGLGKTLEAEIKTYIEDMTPYIGSYSICGNDFIITAYRNEVDVEYPEVVKESDVLGFIAFALKDYPEFRNSVVYEIGKGKTRFDLSFNLDRTGKLEALDLLSDEIIAYLSSLSGEQNSTEKNVADHRVSQGKITINVEPVKEKDRLEEPLNCYRTGVALKIGGAYLIGRDKDILVSTSLYQDYGLSISFDNLLSLGRYTGFGLKAGCSVLAVPAYGDYENVNSFSKFFDGKNWTGGCSIGLDATLRVNLEKTSFYVAFGSGYAFGDSPISDALGLNSWYVDAELGADFKVSRYFNLGIFGNYRCLGSGKKNYVGGGISVGMSF